MFRVSLSVLFRPLLWLCDRMAGTYVSLLCLSLLSGYAFAATSWNVHNVPQMFLEDSITTTQTTNIQIAAPVLNGDTITFPTTTGAVLRFRQGSRREDIYYSSGSVDSTTKVITLYGVTRDVCFNSDTSLAGCGNGLDFSRGAIVEETIPGQLLNLKANIDRLNSFTGSGRLTSSQTNQTFLTLNSVTTAQRDAFTYKGNGDLIYNTTVGSPQFRAGGAWYSFGSGGGLVDATTTVAGRVEIGTIADQTAKTNTGDSGAPVVVVTQHLTQSGVQLNNSYQAGRIPILNSSGALATTLGGLGITNLSTGALLVGQSSLAAGLHAPSSMSGKVLLSDGSRFVSIVPYRILNVKTDAGSDIYAGNTAEKTLYQFAISGSLLRAGSVVGIYLSGQHNGPVAQVVRLRVGGSSGTILATTGTYDFSIGGNEEFSVEGRVTFRSVGAGGTAAGDLFLIPDVHTPVLKYDATTSNISVNTTGTVTFTVTLQFLATNGANAAHYEQAYSTLLTPF